MEIVCGATKQPSDPVTVYICTSPRPLDHGPCIDSIMNLVAKSKKLFRIPSAVISADGRAPNVSDSAWSRYLHKLERVATEPDVTVHQQGEWRHQAHALQDAMKSCSTEYVFVCQDDVTLLIERPDVEYIMHALTHDDVEHVHLSKHTKQDKYSKPGYVHPMFAHLFCTHFWTDRPHFAKLSHYRDFVWPRVPSDAKKTMEEVISFHKIDNMCWRYNTAIIGEEHNQCGACSSFNIRYGLSGGRWSWFLLCLVPCGVLVVIIAVVCVRRLRASRNGS